MIDNHNKMISCASNIIICCIRIMQKKDSIGDSFREHGMHSNQPNIIKDKNPKKHIRNDANQQVLVLRDRDWY